MNDEQQRDLREKTKHALLAALTAEEIAEKNFIARIDAEKDFAARIDRALDKPFAALRDANLWVDRFTADSWESVAAFMRLMPIVKAARDAEQILGGVSVGPGHQAWVILAHALKQYQAAVDALKIKDP